MQVTRFSISGPILIQAKIFSDERGFFCERFRTKEFQEICGDRPFVQENFSRSSARVLRGLHYQYDGPQSKLVTCTSGVIFDVAVDLRVGSPTFGRHVSVTLKGEEPAWFWIPAGFAHGFCVVGSQPADVLYKVDHLYNSKGEAGILWSDADLNIAWPASDPIISSKDQALGRFSEYVANPRF